MKAKPVEGSLEFLEEYSRLFNFAIISGSDQNELRRVCKKRKIDHFFEKILGSPTEKKDNIATLLLDMNWNHKESLYVGDSNNDLEASKVNNLEFIGRCSGLIDWANYDVKSVSDLSSLYSVLH